MKFEKSLTINIGNYNSVRIGCTDAESFEEIDRALRAEMLVMGIEPPREMFKILRKNKSKNDS